ncbi:hypothetical protein CONPUDRAFT_70716 [Coniophora puteana RWD-64-598 SS2]|uniref:Uncharacterized protein n=1 Tax=Coniophora puteana (strain RWD-64-598) TaxID=741705 RepID=A0A5M3MYB0_CONPW|nr:uncharacterized protein CONPUDRAFT_70716 [Coniophora puteana RWD-64-598 SS2]EIW83764.1 hypothetical protein CONPUDRAFT_70716 [Coniophora puteana RWD-64-598 SS2]
MSLPLLPGHVMHLSPFHFSSTEPDLTSTNIFKSLDDLNKLAPRVLQDVNDSLRSSPYAERLAQDPGLDVEPGSQDDQRLRHEIATYHSLMSSIHIITEQLNLCHSKLSQASLAHFRPICALTRMPSEILASIFVLSVQLTPVELHPVSHYGFEPERYDGHLSTYRHAGRTPALNVAQICRHWRAIALGTPELWNVIAPAKLRQLELTPSNDPDGPSPFIQMIMWSEKPRLVNAVAAELLHRSRGAPLMLALDTCGTHYMSSLSPKHTSPAFRGRCEGLEIIYMEEGGFLNLIRFHALPSSGLKRLRLVGSLIAEGTGDELTRHSNLRELCVDVPQRGFNVKTFFPSSQTPTFPGHWRFLTSLQITCNHFCGLKIDTVVLHIYSIAPNLEHLYVQENDNTAFASNYYNVFFKPLGLPQGSALTPFIWQKLRFLGLHSVNDLRTSRLLQALKCPSLVEFVTNAHVHKENVDTFLNNCGESLKRVRLLKSVTHEMSPKLGEDIKQDIETTHPTLKVEEIEKKDTRFFSLPVWYGYVEIVEECGCRRYWDPDA